MENIEYTRLPINELRKCQADPVHFISKYCKIVNRDKGLDFINLNDSHIAMIRAMQEGNAIIEAPRMFGKTTIECLFALWYAIFYYEKNILLGAHNFHASVYMMEIIKIAYQHLPDMFKIGIVQQTKQNMRLKLLAD